MLKRILLLLGKPGYSAILFLSIILENLLGKIKRRGKKRGRPRKKVKKIFPRREIIIPILIFTGLFIVLLTVMVDTFENLPSPDKLIERKQSLTTKIYAKDGTLLYKIYRNENRTLVPLTKIPDHLIKATLAIEDKEFYSHNGLSIKGIIRAMIHNLTKPDESLIGGSTITQQLVKNALLTQEKTWRRKLREAVLAILVESKFSKDEILQMYFNEVPYGGTAYGAEEASQKYFKKHVWDINEAESSLLAGLTRAPTKYSPFGAYPELAKKRQEQVINEMQSIGFITDKQSDEIAKIPLKLAKQEDPILAPHFVFYVKDLLVEKYGEQMVEGGGLEVITTLDLETQKLAETILKEEIEKLRLLNVGNGAVLTINPKTGEILAMVGSKDYFDFQADGNVNVILRPRQPGSAIKIANYVNAFDLGYTAATILSDSPITYQVPGQPPYSPKNYDGKFHGNISLRTAFASSFNVPAVKVLSSYGVDRMVKMGQTLGITTWEDPSRFGLSLTLGGGEVKMIDLAQVYSVFANLGKKVAINPIKEIKDKHGKIIYQNPCSLEDCPSETVVNPGVAFILNDILSDNQARAAAFGQNSMLKVNNLKIAVKTGTTNNLRDNWCIGYTPSLLTAVWVGNNDNRSMSQVVSGITGATPIWHRMMKESLKNRVAENWLPPENVTKVKICTTTGTLPCPQCPKTGEEYFLKGSVPAYACKFEPTPAVNPLEEASKFR